MPKRARGLRRLQIFVRCFMKNEKPLGIKNYGHIPHLPGSRMTPADKNCHEGQARIATQQKRDRHDCVIVQEKLDGSNVGVAKIDGQIVPLSRAGYRAETSPFEQHHKFADWALHPKQRELFELILNDGERIAGEWLYQAHGTRYNLPHEPFVVFDIMVKQTRQPYEIVYERVKDLFVMPTVLHQGDPISIFTALDKLGDHGHHGAIDKAEGCVWRIERDIQIKNQSNERKRVVDFLVKYVRPEKQDGIYLPEISGKPAVYNT